MTQKQWNTTLAVTTIVMTIVAGAATLLYNRDHNVLKGIKAKNESADTSGLTEGQIKYWNSLKV